MAKAKTSGEYVLGFDGGGTKSICVIADAEGRVAGVGLGGCTNFQGNGQTAAGLEVEKAVRAALSDAGVRPEQVSTAAYGISGADRDLDFETVAGYVLPHNPAGEMLLCNDTTIALRAGTADGVGVALICGTGSNCIGFNREGRQAKVGGMGHFTGDSGSGENIVERAIVAAMQGQDGRGPKTSLYERLSEALGLAELIDIIELYYPDDYRPPDLGSLAPVVFRAAARGDRVAGRLLATIGDELARAATTAAKRLFAKDEKFPVVLGGSILQNARPPIFEDRIRKRLEKNYPEARVVKLKDEPVLGAVFYALDMLHGKAGRNRMAAVRRTYREKAVR